MSDPQHPLMPAPLAPGAPAPAALQCPRCGVPIGPEQDWCLECGAPARTRLAPTPSWRLPVAVVVALVLSAGVALAIAFSTLTRDDGPVTTTAPATAPAQPNETTPGAPAGSALPGGASALSSTATPSSTASAPSTATPPAATAP